MAEQTDALTRLVQEHVGDGRPLTVRAFAERAIDPESGRSISKSTAGNLAKGHQVKITPEVLRAIAAGLGVPLTAVQAAAIQQYVGIIVDDPFGVGPGDDDAVVRVAHDPEVTAADMPATRRFLDEARRDAEGA
ncbi:hypothetical protein QOM21_24070 [Streptomyces sp. Pv4-95]|uniref:hypothetical protein n=1 Tax=Streptomyces sp. Pv4-95 TaxID=3049543 RepID=UPI003891812C